MRVAIGNRLISGVTGAASIILEHASRMSQLGWEVHCFAESIDAKRVRAAGAVPHRVLRWPWGSYFKRRLFAWLAGRKIAAGGFDLVFGHGDLLDQDVLYLHNCVHAAHEAVQGVPLPGSAGVGRIHASFLQDRRFQFVVANSRLMADDLGSRFKVPDERIRVVYPGFDPARFRPSDRQRLGPSIRAKLGVPPEGLLVGLITSGDFQKRGVDLFLETLAALPAELKTTTHALIVGRERRLDEYERRTAESGLGSRVHFLQPEPDVAPYFHALDVYVFPCRYEEFGMSALEAMACGLPVLTSARTGVSEILSGEAKGSLPTKPDPKYLAPLLTALLRSAEMRMRWGREAALVSQACVWDAHWKGMSQVCQSTLRQKGVAVGHENSI